MDDLPPVTYQRLPDHTNQFTIHQPTEAAIRYLFRLIEQHLDLNPHPTHSPRRILIDTQGHLLPVLVTFDELRLFYSRYQPPPTRTATLLRLNSPLLNAMQLVSLAVSHYQRNATLDFFDISAREEALAWLRSDQPSRHRFGISR